MNSLFKNWFNWEYWPSYMFYIPNLPYAMYLCIKAKSPVFFSAANPAIKHSGNGTESKFQTLQLLPKKYIPKSIFIKKGSDYTTIQNTLKSADLNFPLIIKPDVGYRGLLVKKINTSLELKSYLDSNNFIDLILQEFIDFPLECGIFYHRLPNESTGKITSITLKEYPTIIGNGASTKSELILSNSRLKRHFKLFQKIQGEKLDEVLSKGQKYILNIIGNHCKGSTFLDGNHLIDSTLESAFDQLFQHVPGFYYGRIDLKYESFNTLKNLENFKIIEVNGIISEPTHIYDPYKSSYFKALKEIRKHWKILYKIATINHKTHSVNYDRTRNFLSSLTQLKKYIKLISEKSRG